MFPLIRVEVSRPNSDGICSVEVHTLVDVQEDGKGATYNVEWAGTVDVVSTMQDSDGKIQGNGDHDTDD